MGFGVVWVTCKCCQGSRMAKCCENLFMGDWVPRKELLDGYGLTLEEVLDLPERWVDCTCPYCDGKGEYEIETFACKIF